MDEPRQLALEVLRRVSTQGAYAGAALRKLMPREFSSLDRGLATELVYGVLRRRSHLDRALKRASGKRLKDLDPRLHDVLRLGAYQLMFLDKIPNHAAVNSSVELAKSRAGPPGGRRANQVLRTLAETSPDRRIPPAPTLAQDPIAHIAAEGSVHQEVANVLVAALGPNVALDFVLASLQAATPSLRANRLRTRVDALAQEVQGTIGTLPYSIRLPKGVGHLPSEFSAVLDGRASPQDEASMRVIELLDPQPGEQLLDVCAAPGGKTCHAAEMMNDHGKIIAHDRLPERLQRVTENAHRLGLRSIETTLVLPEPEPIFDRVLVDAPCSGLGTLRRHPEIRWRFRKSDLNALEPTQNKVLAAGAARVKPGGILVYSVCTVTQEEGRDRVRQLDNFQLEAELSTGPHEPGHPDGFYAARLRRKI